VPGRAFIIAAAGAFRKRFRRAAHRFPASDLLFLYQAESCTRKAESNMVPTNLIESLLSKTARRLTERRRYPESTYRLQFNSGFTFRQARDVVPYLHDLGVSDCYASPYLMARPGSLHGYDISDHNRLNPEIGSDEDYEALCAALREHGLGQLLDVVPNHMGIGSSNLWWNDVLENGPSSPYAGFFDIDWHSALRPELHDKVLLPMLGDPYGKALESGQLTLQYDSGAFSIRYFKHSFPLSPDTYDRVLRMRIHELEEALGATSEAFIEYQSIVTAVTHLPPRSETDSVQVAERQREKEVIKRRLATLTEANPAVRAHVEENVLAFNGTLGEAHSFDRLDALLNAQAYRLSYWRVAADEINYRRFFDINELAALSMEKAAVFEATHKLVLRLVAQGCVSGLRIDHPDGLFDPREYLQRLQSHFAIGVARTIFETDPEFAGQDWGNFEEPLLDLLRQSAAGSADSPFRRPLYVVVEKILGRGEPVPEDWPVHGTTGYEYLNQLGGLFVQPESAVGFSRLYERWRGHNGSFADVVHQKKFLILQVSLASELHVLAHQLDRLSEENRWSRDFTLNSLRHAVREIIACFPVYRSYISGEPIHPRDRVYVLTAVARAKNKNPAISESLFDFVHDMLLLKFPEGATDEEHAAQRRFVGKFQQVTAPVMAKGVEDTAYYVHNRLVSLNEVGGDPSVFGVTPAAFHQHNLQRREHWPHSLSATSTHDTKRSEDVRARIAVLSELPQEWQKALSRWGRLNKKHRLQLDDLTVPDRNDEYLFYQTLIGAWPLEPFEGSLAAEFSARLQAYMEKATHEAKVHTSWINPHPDYDDGVRQFVALTLDRVTSGPFLDDLQTFQKRIAHFGLLNSLSQVLLKIASPGVPDTYQGTELWDFSLVDPDNRRPVDYDLRRRLLCELKAQTAEVGTNLAEFARRLAETKEDGRVKLYVTWRALHARRDHPGLFTTGDYLPAEAVGSRGDHVCAFVRRAEGAVAVAAAPRLMTRLVAQTGELPVGAAVWEDTQLLLPGVEPGRRLRNVFTGEEVVVREREGKSMVAAADVFANFPVALMLAV
jgi:(1->4)-alpha-D-glucan 1-alpha-D-glucosylmutase